MPNLSNFSHKTAILPREMSRFYRLPNFYQTSLAQAAKPYRREASEKLCSSVLVFIRRCAPNFSSSSFGPRNKQFPDLPSFLHRPSFRWFFRPGRFPGKKNATQPKKPTMPNRPPKTKRPDWNTEPDYHQRETHRLALVARIRAQATRYSETDNICPGCDTRIWEADVDGILYRGCHCMTLIPASNDPLCITPIDLAAWEERVNQNSTLLALGYRQMADRN